MIDLSWPASFADNLGVPEAVPRDLLMAYYFLSDVHLRLDYPDRAERLAQFVRGLEVQDSVIILGDLCDFWMASRQVRDCMAKCEGLKALQTFAAAGGELTIVAGNHDASLGYLFKHQVGARFHAGSLTLNAAGIQLHMVHGHDVLQTWHWKRFLETRLFRFTFSLLPNVVADRFSQLLDSVNDEHRPRNHARMLAVYRRYLEGRSGDADLYLFGHVHERVDERVGQARMVVLGDWKKSLSYLKIADGEVDFLP